MSESTRTPRQYQLALVSILFRRDENVAWLLEEITEWVAAGKGDDEIKRMLKERGGGDDSAIAAGIDRGKSIHIFRKASAAWRDGAAESLEVSAAKERILREAAIHAMSTADAVRSWLLANGASAELAAHLAASPEVRKSTQGSALFFGVVGLLIGVIGLIFSAPVIATGLGFLFGVAFLAVSVFSSRSSESADAGTKPKE